MTSAFLSSPLAATLRAETGDDAPVMLAPLWNPLRPVLPYTAFIARITKLLEAQMPGTALVVCNGAGRIALDPQVGIVTYEAGESLDDAYDLDSSAWDDSMGAWDGETHAQTWRYLERPEFDLTHATLEGERA